MMPRASRSPRARRFGHVRADEDLITPTIARAAALPARACRRRPPPRGSYDRSAAKRGETLFNGKANCGGCHVPPLFTEPGWNMHTAAEIGIDDFQASRSPDGRYRTAPLRGLWTHTQGRLLSRRPIPDAGRGDRSLRLTFLVRPVRG